MQPYPPLGMQVYTPNLSNFIWMNPASLYLKTVSYLIQSTPHKTTVVCDVINLYDFTLFVSRADHHPNVSTHHQLIVVRAVIQLRSISCKCIWSYSTAKISHTFIFFCSRCLIISLGNIFISSN